MNALQPPPPDALDHFSDSNFRALAEVIEARVGIKMPPSKRTMVEGRLRKRVRALNLKTVDDYAKYVFDLGHLEQEIGNLIDCVTTNKTDFFREPAHFDFLHDVAVPKLVKARGSRNVNLKIWSSACSTGAEVYTIAMVLQDMLSARNEFRYSVLGTDISSEVLQEARSAIYPKEFVAAVPEPMRKRYVMFAREARRSVARIVPELRARTRFERLNLMDSHYPVDDDVDVIFCRNVLIYFDKPTQRTVVGRLVSHLRPGGFLILGHSESMAAAGISGITQMMPTVFMATAGAAKRSAA